MPNPTITQQHRSRRRPVSNPRTKIKSQKPTPTLTHKQIPTTMKQHRSRRRPVSNPRTKIKSQKPTPTPTHKQNPTTTKQHRSRRRPVSNARTKIKSQKPTPTPTHKQNPTTTQQHRSRRRPVSNPRTEMKSQKPTPTPTHKQNPTTTQQHRSRRRPVSKLAQRPENVDAPIPSIINAPDHKAQPYGAASCSEAGECGFSYTIQHRRTGPQGSTPRCSILLRGRRMRILLYHTASTHRTPMPNPTITQQHRSRRRPVSNPRTEIKSQKPTPTLTHKQNPTTTQQYWSRRRPVSIPRTKINSQKPTPTLTHKQNPTTTQQHRSRRRPVSILTQRPEIADSPIPSIINATDHKAQPHGAASCSEAGECGFSYTSPSSTHRTTRLNPTVQHLAQRPENADSPIPYSIDAPDPNAQPHHNATASEP